MVSTRLTPVKWSTDRYHEMIRAGVLEDCCVELLDEGIVEMAPVDPLHDDVREELATYLRLMLGDQGTGQKSHSGNLA